MAQVADVICSDYDVQPDMARADTAALLDELAGAGLVVTT